MLTVQQYLSSQLQVFLQDLVYSSKKCCGLTLNEIKCIVNCSTLVSCLSIYNSPIILKYEGFTYEIFIGTIHIWKFHIWNFHMWNQFHLWTVPNAHDDFTYEIFICENTFIYEILICKNNFKNMKSKTSLYVRLFVICKLFLQSKLNILKLYLCNNLHPEYYLQLFVSELN